MSTSDVVRSFRAGEASVYVFARREDLAAAAARQAASLIRAAIARRGRARIVVATGNSQLEFIAALVNEPEVDWRSVEVFHLDEYIGLPAAHPASFRLWVKTRLLDKVHPGAAHLMNADAPDLDGELRRYSELLNQAPLDVAFVGIGENGHIAFNDPHVADFDDPLTIKRVTLDEASRRQQVGEGHFPNLSATPAEAVTLTCSALMRVDHWVCCVPESRKAVAVRNALEGPITPQCPASLMRRRTSAFVYLDRDSAALLSVGSKP